MRRSRLTVLALGAVTLAGLASTAPAAADPYDYPWCAQGRGWGYPGECMYQTYQQCLDSVSGQDLGCGENPRFLFRGQQQPQPQPDQQPRRHRRDHHSWQRPPI